MHPSVPRDTKTENVTLLKNITTTRRVAPMKANSMKVIGNAELVEAPTSQKCILVSNWRFSSVSMAFWQNFRKM